MQTAPARRPRDPRLDVFRGLGMWIILIAHIPGNPWTLWIPARFGFSDATEIFVFCSGMASALAFGAIFRRAGWVLGTLRILQRMWQVYWAHLGVFFTALFCMLVLNATGWFEKDYIAALNLYPFITQTGSNLIGLMTLTYVPNYFDILPMYIVILAMIPLAMALARINPKLVVLVSVLLWLWAGRPGVSLPAELWFAKPSSRGWFFDPFAWQLVFFTGFALQSGWIPAPPVRRWLVVLAAAYVIVTLPLAWHVLLGASETLRQWRGDLGGLVSKTNVGALRYLHFLAVAYLAWVAVGPGGARLAAAGPLVPVLMRVGQQSLAVFMASMVLARVFGVGFDLWGSGPIVTVVINLGGIAVITGIAYAVGWMKSEPWRQPAQSPAPHPAPRMARS
ncbi:OpgC family protein [Gemmobacter denitrificans]|uniref:OpgC domain-containing protein n=1 Tax=Gemmobacter denitrificans TaxID=3123040 RepID=A0ABU8BZW0_9RHOB